MKRTVILTDEEISLITEALDSHCYWQLSDQRYRNSGYVCDPGSDDPEARRDLRAAAKLEAKLEKVARDSRTLRQRTSKRAQP